MKVTKETLLAIDLVVDNEWLDYYIELINNYENYADIPYETQSHHIIPQFYYENNKLEVNDEPYNKVNLPIKQHIIAHYFLSRCSTNKYKGSGYASISYILKNVQAKRLPDLETFVSLLDGIETMYLDYRNRIAEAQRKPEVRRKKSISGKRTWTKISKDRPEWFLKRNKTISDKLKGVPKSEDHKLHLSESRINSGVAKGENNPFFGKEHTQETKDILSMKNGDSIVATNENTSIVFSSMNRAAQYIIDNIDDSFKIGATIKHIKSAAASNTVLYSFYWKVQRKNRKKHVISPEGLENTKKAVAEAKGFKILCSKGDIAQEFCSLAEASRYISAEGLDTLHFKNIGRKIKLAIEDNTELYGYNWKYK